jgi:DNA polymerase-3 subunit gamma/tau
VATDDVLAVLGVAEAELILAAADAIAAGDGRAALEAGERLARSGRDVSQFGRDLLAHLRQLLVIRTVGDVGEAFSVTAADEERLRTQAEAFSDLALTRAIDVIAAALAAVKEGDEPRMTLELAILRAARPQLDPTRQALLQRIERLEAALGGSAGSPPDAHAEIEPTKMSAQLGARRDDSQHSPSPAKSAPAPEGNSEATAPEAMEAAEDQAARAPTAVVEREPIDLERVRDLWPAVIDQVGESGSELLSTVLAAARPVDVDAEHAVLKVGFPPSAAFNKRKAEAQEARERFAAAIRAITGQGLRPVYVMLETDEETEPREREPLSDDEVIELLRSEFDAEEFEEADKRDAEEAG